jgi:hypothetical protein
MTFDIRQIVVDAETGEYDEEAAIQYQETLEELFAQSPEGTALTEQGETLGWVSPFLSYAMSYLGVTPAEMTAGDFDEVLFELFPRKVAAGPEEAAAIVDELRAFWAFLGRAYSLPNAPALLKLLDSRAATRLERAMANPANFGMAKSLVMQGQARGFDTTTKEGLDAWIQTYNVEQTLAVGAGPAQLPQAALLPHTGRKPGKQSKEKHRRKMAKASRKQNRHKQVSRRHRSLPSQPLTPGGIVEETVDILWKP